jgi:hypothetical protein
VNTESALSGVAGVLALIGIGTVVMRLRLGAGSRSWAIAGLLVMVSVALLASAKFLRLQSATLALVTDAALLLSAGGVGVLIYGWRRAH